MKHSTKRCFIVAVRCLSWQVQDREKPGCRSLNSIEIDAAEAFGTAHHTENNGRLTTMRPSDGCAHIDAKWAAHLDSADFIEAGPTENV